MSMGMAITSGPTYEPGLEMPDNIMTRPILLCRTYVRP